MLLLPLGHLLARLAGFAFRGGKEVVVNSYIFCWSIFLTVFWFALLWFFLLLLLLFSHLTCNSSWVFLFPSFGQGSSFQKAFFLLLITSHTLLLRYTGFLCHFCQYFFAICHVFSLNLHCGISVYPTAWEGLILLASSPLSYLPFSRI